MDKLAIEASEIIGHIDRVSVLSNLALQLYRWYIKNGHARNEHDETDIKEFFKKNLPPNTASITDFYERLYLYQSYCWYAFIRQDFLMYYRYSQKWINIQKREISGHQTGRGEKQPTAPRESPSLFPLEDSPKLLG